MAFLPKIVMIPALVLGWTSTAQATKDTDNVRFMSLMVQDNPPTVDELKSFLGGNTTLTSLRDTWLASEAHDSRVERFFNDLFGVNNHIFVFNEERLLEQGDDYYYADIKGDCGAAAAVETNAWWSDTPVKVCPDLVSDKVFYDDPEHNCMIVNDEGFLNSSCGCGPEMIICMPRHHEDELRGAMQFESAKRGRYAYREGLSWMDYLGGDFFYGNRFLYFFYMLRQSFPLRDHNPTAAELAALKAIPLDSEVRADFPAAAGIERAGIVTSPGFLNQYNNFRSRVRALTNQLLCQDVDGSLNVDDIATFKNPDFTEVDLEHGTKGDCASCHYPMDNMGSTLFGWNDQGFYEHYAPKSQLGHSFGQEGTGPQFLARSYIERATGFASCMARKVWEDFTSIPWERVDQTKQATMVAAAAEGPTSLIQSVVNSDTVLTLRTRGLDAEEEKSFDFTTEINPILQRSCAGSSCHDSTSALGARYQYIDNPGSLVGAPAVRIENGSMPPSGSGFTLSEDDKATLVDYLNQQGSP